MLSVPIRLPPSWGTRPVPFRRIKLASGSNGLVRRAPFSRQGLEVEVRIVAAQAEPEAILARGSAVACTLVAAGLRQRGQYLVCELDRIRLLDVADLNDRLGFLDPTRTSTSAWPLPRGSIRPS